MSDEIKEYLDTLKEIVGEGKSKGTYGISYWHWKEILDYVTNLQQENDDKDWKIDLLGKKLDDLTDNWISRGKKIEDLKQENKRLKRDAAKAIEVLKQDKQSASFNSAEALAINILRGGKDE